MKITFLVSGNVRSNFSHRPLVLARALHELGHEVVLIAPKADKYNKFIPETVTDIDGVRIVQPFQFTTRWPEINLLPYMFSAAVALLREKPDLVYIYKPTPISVIGLLSKFFRGVEIVADFDDLGSEVMRIEGHPWYQRSLVAWSERIAKKYADRLVAASTYLFEKLSKEFPTKPILGMPNGVEKEWFGLVAPSTHSKRIVFMGSINRKNILAPLFDVLPELLKIHPDCEVVIIGDGAFLPYFKKKVAGEEMAKHVTFLGWLPIEAAKDCLHSGDIGYSYMPDEITNRAASNMKVSQYMARGVVPLVSDVGDLPAIVDFGHAGYISKFDKKSLKQTFLQALEDPERTAKSKKAMAFAKDYFNWSTLTQDIQRMDVAGTPAAHRKNIRSRH